MNESAQKYYLAYGSNLNVEQMKLRCPDAEVVGTAMLEGWQLAFRGSRMNAHLTIERQAEAKTPVGIWLVTAEDEKNLDRYEGYPSYYRKVGMGVTCAEKSGKIKHIVAFVYIMTPGLPAGAPSREYWDICRVGYSDFGFDDAYLKGAQEYSRTRTICPKCHKGYLGYPAISREDNKTEICPDCGEKEALHEFIKAKWGW